MVKLSQMMEAITSYIKLHGDKEIISIATYNGSSEYEYELHLCDIYDGPVGSNPFTGRDSIKLRKNDSTEYAALENMIKSIKESAIEAGNEAVSDILGYDFTGEVDDLDELLDEALYQMPEDEIQMLFARFCI